MHLQRMSCQQTNGVTVEEYAVFTPDGREASHARTLTLPSRYGETYLPTLAVGGIGTAPLQRRNGCVRMLFDHLFAQAPERGWAVSVLHPFSFAYYRRFGYEKVSEHIQCAFPMTAIAYLPRCTDFQEMRDNDILADVLAVYERFTAGRNLAFRRSDGAPYQGRTVYVWYDADGQPAAYIVLEGEGHFCVNRMVGDCLHVHEMAYTSRDGLLALFGLIRMFEGEYDTVRLHDIAMLPEVELILRNYTHTTYQPVSDLSLRILDVAAVLRANPYPEQAGRFTLRVEDSLDYVRGSYVVEYGGGQCAVSRTAPGEQYDLCVPAPALARLLYGTQPFDARIAAYLDGVQVRGRAADFFRAFPPRINGLYEHF